MLRTTIRSGFAVVLLACMGAAAAAISPTQAVQQRFVDEVTTGWQSFEVCEHRTRASRDAFFAAALDLQRGSGTKVREAREVTVRESSGGPALHLGVAELELPSAEVAARIDRAPSGGGPRFLAGTKILTRYVTARQDRRLLVVYSETHLRPDVKAFLDRLEARPGQVWDSR